MAESETYGKKIQYDPLWSGPMDKPRRPTDTKFLLALGIFCLCWFGIAIYAYSHGDIGNNFKNFEDSFLPTSLRDKRSIPDQRISHSSSINRVSSAATTFIGVSALLSISYIVLLRWFATFIVYTAIFLFFNFLFFVICVSTTMYVNDDQRTDALAVLVLSVILFVVLVIIFLMIKQKIKIACEVIRESSKAVMFFPSTLLFPILPYFLYIVVGIFFASVYVYLSAIPKHYNESQGYVNILHLINFFGLLWLIGFVTAFSQMILSGTFATWYWSRDKRHVPYFTLMNFMEKTVKYHLGTIAFGSLILAICHVIRMLLNFIKKRLEGSCNPFACCCFGWYQRLFGTFEKILRYITRNAYIMCAIHGTDFFQSAKDSFNLLMRNIIKVLVINKVTEGILILGQLLTIGLSSLGVYKYYQYDLENYEMTATLGTVIVCSTLITASFFMVLRTAIDTIFLSVLEDYERNDGSEDRPYYMSYKLKSLLLE